MAIRHIDPYSGEWHDQPVSYVRQVVAELGGAEWWSGPCDPRQATVLLGAGEALVWDEECGWHVGGFLSGSADRHTELERVRYLGGGLLPRPERVPEALADARAGVGASSAWRPCYRSHRHCRDGFDLALTYYTQLVNA